MQPWPYQSWLKQLIRSCLFGRCRPIRTRLPRTPRLCLEQLEGRILPSGSGGAAVPLAVGVHLNLQEFHDPSRIPAGLTASSIGILPKDNGTPVPTGYTPIQLQTAYGINAVKFGSLTGNGSGQTIAIVDAYDDPSFVDSTDPNFATSDLAQFDATVGLPDPPSFTKLNEYGQTTNLPGTDPSGAGNPNGNWEIEEALDIEWSHAIAPGANIVIVEANSATSEDLYTAVATAADLPGVSVVSMSWGEDEYSGETADDGTFVTPAGHQGVTFLASSGDNGGYSYSDPGTAGIIYPSASPNVVSVGGTSLQLNADNTIASETAWSGSGGGTSLYETEPTYQLGVQTTTFRTTPDVAFDADPYTGVSVYDSYNDTDNSGPWVTIGGTSVAAPCWAGLIAITNQGRVLAGGETLDGPGQTLPALYAISSSDFNDITSGSNGVFSAGPGYDEVTGLGSPRTAALTADLTAYGVATQIAVTSQPPNNLIVGDSFGLVVAAETSQGDVDPAFNGTLTITLAAGPSDATLGGTLTATASHGVAVFDGLTLDQLGTGYSIQVSSSNFPSITTNSFDVIADPTPWQGTYYPVPTDASLRAAINAADSNSLAFNTILLSGSTYLLSDTSAGGLLIENTSSLSSKTLTITGQGPTSSIIGAVPNWNDRIFEIVGSAKQTLNVTLQDLTIQGGNALNGGVLGGKDALGGGLLINDANVTLANDVVQNNQAHGGLGATGSVATGPGKAGGAGGTGTNGKGGGIYLASGMLSLVNDTLRNNAARGGLGGQGGAGGGQGTLSAAALTGGQGGTGGKGGSAAGGGLYAAAGTVVVRTAAFSSNKAVGGPGGHGGTGGSGGHGTVNTPGKPGGVGGVGGLGGAASAGGIYLGGGTLTLAVASLLKNSAVGGAGGQGGIGGGGTALIGGSTGVFGGSGSSFGDKGLTSGGSGSSSSSSSSSSSNSSSSGTVGGYYYAGGQGGKGGSGGVGGVGSAGGVYVAAGSLTLVNATLASNQAVGGQGGVGGLGGSGGFVSTTTSSGHLVGKTAGNGGLGGNGGVGQGGGIQVGGGTVALFANTLNGNTALGGKGGTGGHGGNGPFDFGFSGSFGSGSPTGSRGNTVGGANSAGAGGNGGNGGNGNGGGVFVSGGSLTLTNATVASNTAQAGASGAAGSGGQGETTKLTGGPGSLGSAGASSGGGLYVTAGTVTLNNSTVALNTQTGNGSGGGAVVQSAATVTAVSTLFAGNGTGDYSGNVTATDSLFQTAPTGNLSGSGNQTNVDPLLDPNGLQNNGGLTQTIALQPTSPAIGAGTNPDNLFTDQRGYDRPTRADSTDIGAYQTTMQSDTQAPTVTLQAPEVTPPTISALNPYTFTITYSDDVAVALATLSGAVVQVLPPGGGAPMTAVVESKVAVGTTDGSGDAQSFVVTYQITPPGGVWSVADNGTYTVTLGGAPITDLEGNAAATGTLGTFSVVAKYATNTSISAAASNANPSHYGQSLSFTATVSNTLDSGVTPTGWVSFYNGSAKLVTLNLVSGSATYTTSTLNAGSYSLTATYIPTDEFSASTSDPTTPVLQTIDADSTSTSITASASNPSPSIYGQALSFTATVANTSGTGLTPTGSVSFYNGTTKLITISLVSGSATYTNATLQAGNYSLTATYNGTIDFATSSSNPTSPILQTINPASTSTTISAASSNPSPSICGQSLSFTATVANISGTGQTPTGSVSFYNGTTKLITISLVSGSATYTNATLQAGNYSLTATYNGTTDFAASSSNPTSPILQTINPASTSTTISAASNNDDPSHYGQSISFTATVANTSGTGLTPTGSVNFYNGTTKLITISLVSGSATYTTTILNTGSYSLTAKYTGTNDFTASSSDPTMPILQTIEAASTTTTIGSSSGNPSPASYGQSLSFTATVANLSSSVTPTGTVSFYNGSTFLATLNLVSGAATYTTSALPVGSDSLTATYNGTTDFASSASDPTNPDLQTINPDSTSTSVVSSINPTLFGQAASFTVTVANTTVAGITPTGTVTLQDVLNGVTTSLGNTSLVNGMATFTSSNLDAGQNTITAIYSPDTDFSTSSGTLLGGQTVTQASTTTTLKSSLNPSLYGQMVTITATVAADSGTFDNGGTVQFLVDGTNFGNPVTLSNGTSSIQESTLEVGTHAITATYSGDTNFIGSSSTTALSQAINVDSTSTSLSASAKNVNPSKYGQSLSFTATVANTSVPGVTPMGTVSFYNGSTFLATLNLVSGAATYTTSALPVGSDSLTATYNGTTDFASSASDPTNPVLQTINPDSTSTSVTGTPNPAQLGQAVSFTVTVANTTVAGITPTGTVTLQDVLNGVTTSLGNTNLVNGMATFNSSNLALGNHTITATYSPDTDFSTSSGTLLGGQTVTQASTTTTLKSSLNPSLYGQMVTITATVAADSGTFDNGGTVQFLVDGTNFGNPVTLSNGTASIQESTLEVGTHAITATYSGDTNFVGSSSTTALSQAINVDSTSTSLSASAKNVNPSKYGQSLSITATVANTSVPGVTPTGTVSIYNGSTFLATLNLVSGAATYSPSTLDVGSYSFTAIYNGTKDFTSSASDPTNPVLQTINPDSTSTSVTGTPNPAQLGQAVTLTIAVKNTSGTPPTPTGTVTIEDTIYGVTTILATVNLTNGMATFTTSKLARGTHKIQVIYNPTIDFLASPEPGLLQLRVGNL